MKDTHFADVGKKDGMSLTLALIVLDRLNTTERIDVERDSLREAVKVVSAAAKKYIRIAKEFELFNVDQSNKPIPVTNRQRDGIEKVGDCPRCGAYVQFWCDKFCRSCGQALDWS